MIEAHSNFPVKFFMLKHVRETPRTQTFLVSVDISLLNEYRQRKLESAHVVVSCKMAADGVAVGGGGATARLFNN